MIKEVKLDYTAYMLSKLARDRWGDNSTEHLAAIISIFSSHDQMKMLVNSLKEKEGESK